MRACEFDAAAGAEVNEADGRADRARRLGRAIGAGLRDRGWSLLVVFQVESFEIFLVPSLTEKIGH